MSTSGFDELGLSDALLQALGEAGYKTPTPIQAQAIPYVLMGRDVLGCAQTGTGKTASFTLPMIDILASGRAKARMPRSVIISPTRELAAQIAENFEKYGQYSKLSMALLIGGESFVEQQKKLTKGVDVLIATPGRLLDMFERGKILLSDVKLFVIDEADRMLDMGFIPDVERIAGMLPPLRQTLFFSATMAKEIRRLADMFLTNPKEITVSPPERTATTVAQHLLWVAPRRRREALRHLLSLEEVSRAFIFCNRKRDIRDLTESLVRDGFSAGELHGDMSQPERTAALERFRNNEVPLLVCSDVAARGIDISDISHVFNFEVPFNPEDYIHRVGRTGRAGKTGRAFSFATPDEAKYVEGVEALTKEKLKVFEIEDLAFGSPDAVQTKRAPKSGSRRSAAPAEEKPADDRPRRGRRRDDEGAADAPRPARASRGRGRGSDFGGGSDEPTPSRNDLLQRLPSGLTTEGTEFDRACEAFEWRVPAFMLRAAAGGEPVPATETAG